MKILVISDTHGIIVESVINFLKNENNIDLLIHCGDKYDDGPKIAYLLGLTDFYRVVGNTDYGVKNGETHIKVVIENKKFLITHGHFENVKDGLDELKCLAQAENADIVLFGHTHTSYDEIDNNIIYFNSGSPVLPRGCKASYGIIEICGDNIIRRIETI